MSEDAMTPARFAALAEAYGAQIRRWPEDERITAEWFAETDLGKDILRQAAELDALLDRYIVAAPSPALRARVLQSATARAAKQRSLRWGLSLAGVGFAGLLAGLIVTSFIALSVYTPLDHPAISNNGTAFGDIAPDSDASEED
jgi:anti-sigma factor RsiW